MSVEAVTAIVAEIIVAAGALFGLAVGVAGTVTGWIDRRRAYVDALRAIQEASLGVVNRIGETVGGDPPLDQDHDHAEVSVYHVARLFGHIGIFRSMERYFPRGEEDHWHEAITRIRDAFKERTAGAGDKRVSYLAQESMERALLSDDHRSVLTLAAFEQALNEEDSEVARAVRSTRALFAPPILTGSSRERRLIAIRAAVEDLEAKSTRLIFKRPGWKAAVPNWPRFMRRDGQ